jgi:hypothetical protein
MLMLAKTVLLRRACRTGLLVLLLLIVSGLAATAASACTLPWTRTPNDGVHYFAGAFVTNGSANQNLNGASADIWINDPTLHTTYYTSSWVGMVTYDSGGLPVLVQDGYLKFAGGSDKTFYQICNESACWWTGSNTQGVTVGTYYNFNVYSQGGDAFFDFAGVLKNTVHLSDYGIGGITSSTPWDPTVQAEPASYGVQMAGTSGNHETYSTLESRRWCGSSTCWDNTTDQAWATSGTTLPALGSVHFSFPNGNSGSVSQTRINNSFKNTYTTPYGYPVVQLWDMCTTS